MPFRHKLRANDNIAAAISDFRQFTAQAFCAARKISMREQECERLERAFAASSPTRSTPGPHAVRKSLLAQLGQVSGRFSIWPQ
jgi:hypothetical protein